MQILSTYSYFVSFRDTKEIVFYNAYHLTEPMTRYSVSPSEPGRLCTSNVTYLLYEDLTTKPRQLRWLDCTVSPHPAPLQAGVSITYTRHASLVDICCVRRGYGSFLVTARGFHGIDAYNVTSSKLEWSIIGKLPGMKKGLCAWALTTDNAGTLLVADKGNKCIQMFSTEGMYLRCLSRSTLGVLWAIHWWSSEGTLLCAHKKDDTFYISMVPEREVGESGPEVPSFGLIREAEPGVPGLEPVELPSAVMSGPQIATTHHSNKQLEAGPVLQPEIEPEPGVPGLEPVVLPSSTPRKEQGPTQATPEVPKIIELQNNRVTELEEPSSQTPSKEMESSQETVVSDWELSMEEDMDAELGGDDGDEPMVEIMVVDSPEPTKNVIEGPFIVEDAYLSNYEGKALFTDNEI